MTYSISLWKWVTHWGRRHVRILRKSLKAPFPSKQELHPHKAWFPTPEMCAFNSSWRWVFFPGRDTTWGVEGESWILSVLEAPWSSVATARQPEPTGDFSCTHMHCFREGLMIATDAPRLWDPPILISTNSPFEPLFFLFLKWWNESFDLRPIWAWDSYSSMDFSNNFSAATSSSPVLSILP